MLAEHLDDTASTLFSKTLGQTALKGIAITPVSNSSKTGTSGFPDMYTQNLKAIGLRDEDRHIGLGNIMIMPWTEGNIINMPWLRGSFLYMIIYSATPLSQYSQYQMLKI